MIEKKKLLKAIIKRSVPQVQDAIVDGEDSQALDEHGRSCLHLSAFLGCDDLVKFFIAEGLNINQKDKDSVTPLHRACRSGCEKTVGILISHGADPEAKADRSIRPLHIAAAFGNSRCIDALFTATQDVIDVSCKDVDNNQPIHYAACEGHVEAIQVLVKHNCDVNARNHAMNTPLHYAAACEITEACELLCNSGVEYDAQNLSEQTPLHMATQVSSAENVFHLLKAGADPNIRDNKGNTCSHLAIKNGQIGLIGVFMLDPRTDPSISDKDENTVLHVALKLGHYNLIPMMLPRARDLTKQDAHGCSIIIEAIKNQLEELAIEMLAACPSLVHTVTNDLVTPLHLAAERGMTNLTRQLLMAGAQVDAVDSGGLTPSLYCAKNDSVLECLSMIEDVMISDNNLDDSNDQQQHVKGNSSKASSRISS